MTFSRTATTPAVFTAYTAQDSAGRNLLRFSVKGEVADLSEQDAIALGHYIFDKFLVEPGEAAE